jgi:hypothetical protein
MHLHHSQRMLLTDMSLPCVSRNYYSPGSASLYFGDRSLGVRLAKVVFDSGSSFTYFAAKPYQALVTAVGLKPSSPVTQMNRE